MSEPALFDIPAQPDPTEKLSPGQVRTRRQGAAVAAGLHPLSVALQTRLRLHPEVDAQLGTGPRCGGCKFRQHMHGGNRSYPKCAAHPQRHVGHNSRGEDIEWHSYPRATHGAGTDVRAAWPACTDWQEIPG